ncbi:hypothetical protein GGH92_005694, partial [Coemansia sp. RSA 2673]
FPVVYASEASNSLDGVFFGIQAQGGFMGMFGDLYSSSSFYSPLQAKILLVAPISTPIAIHQKPTVDLPAALPTDRACSDLLWFLDDVVHAQASVGESHVSDSDSTSANTSTPAASPADDVKPEPTLSRKRTRKDAAAQTTKRLKLAVEAADEEATAEPDAQERPFACGKCKKRFSRNSDLKRHVKGHTGERPHKCPICLCAFARSDTMARQEGKCMVIPSLS